MKVKNLTAMLMILKVIRPGLDALAPCGCGAADGAAPGPLPAAAFGGSELLLFVSLEAAKVLFSHF